MTRRTLLPAVGLGSLLCALAPAVNANSVSTGYGAYRPSPGIASQQCVTNSSNGGAVNQCNGPIAMIFDLPITAPSQATSFTVTARTAGSGTGAFSCRAIALSAQGNGSTLGASVAFASSGIDTKQFFVTVSAAHALRLQCTGVPVGRGILSLIWAPTPF